MAPKQTHKRLTEDESISDQNSVVGLSVLRPLKKHKASAEWPKEAEEAFLRLIIEEIAKKDSKKCTPYRTWRSFQIFLSKTFKVRYKVAMLKEKFNSLRWSYCRFSNMSDHKRNPHTNLMIAKEDLWRLRYIKEKQLAKMIHENGKEHFELLSRIFYEPTPSWESIFTHDNFEFLCSNALAASRNFLIELDSCEFTVALTNYVVGRYGPMLSLAMLYGATRLKSLFKPPKRTDDHSDQSEMKRIISSIIDTARHILVGFKNAGNHGDKVPSLANDPYSVDDCMGVLDAIDGIEAINYFLAFQKFKNSNCRKKFLFMSDAERKQWVESLCMIIAKDANKRS